MVCLFIKKQVKSSQTAVAGGGGFSPDRSFDLADCLRCV